MKERKVEASFWISLATMFFAGGGLLLFESYARYTGKVPTISEKAAFAAFKHPNGAVGITFVVAAALGALAAHFGAWIHDGKGWVRTGPWMP